jgi:hypothetical protein
MAVVTHGSFDEGPIILALPPSYTYDIDEVDPVFTAWDKSTGITISASQVTDFDTEVANNTAVALNTAKNSYPSADASKMALIPTPANIVTYIGATTNIDLGTYDIAVGKVTISDAPGAPTDAATKGYVDGLLSTGMAWDIAVIDIVDTLPGGPSDGDRYILIDGVEPGNNHINQWDDTGGVWVSTHPATNTTLYVEGNIDAPFNNIGLHTFNGTDWVYIGASIKHNDTSDIQGGDTGNRWHLNSSEWAEVGGVLTSSTDAKPTGLVGITGVEAGVDGSETAYVTLTWNAISTSTFAYYNIRWRLVGGGYKYEISKTNTITIRGLMPGATYNFGVASVTKSGYQSDFCDDIIVVASIDSTPPDDVVGVTAIGTIQAILIQWDNSDDLDIDKYVVYRNTTNDSATSSEVARVSTDYYIDYTPIVGTTYYYWLKAKDYSNNFSVNFSTVASSSARNVASVDAALSFRGWTQNCVFSATDINTVSWTSGTFTSSSGTSYSISAGNTGDMSAQTYIYLDILTSTTAYQVTTTAANAVGDNKVLIGSAMYSVAPITEATFFIFGGIGGANLTAASIVAGTITSNEIAANTITSGNILAGTIEATDINTSSITNLENLIVASPHITLDGGTTFLNSWQHSGGVTTIDGGKIEADTVTATQINVTNLSSINSDLGAMTGGSLVISGGGNNLWLNDSGDGGLSVGGVLKGSAPFRVTSAGVVTATAGTIGNWTIQSVSLVKDTGSDFNSSGMAPNDYPFYAGATYANRAGAPFRVTTAGVVSIGTLSITGLTNYTIPRVFTNGGMSDSNITDNGKVTITTSTGLVIPRINGSPANPEAGMIFYNTANGHYYGNNGAGTWLLLG